MKFNPGIITSKMEATREFYTQILGWNVEFENDFYLLIKSPEGSMISFLLPNHSSQQPIFQSEFSGKGVYITVDVSDVDTAYERMKKAGVPIEVPLRDEPWGDRHFAIVDPNGIGVDIVTYSTPDSEQ